MTESEVKPDTRKFIEETFFTSLDMLNIQLNKLDREEIDMKQFRQFILEQRVQMAERVMNHYQDLCLQATSMEDVLFSIGKELLEVPQIMTESKDKQLESLCAEVSYMFVLNTQNEIVYVVNDMQSTNSTTEEEYRHALDSFITRQYQFKSLYEIVNEQIVELHPRTNHKRLCMHCVGKSDVNIIHDMCIHEFIMFLERIFQDRNIVQL